MTGRLIQVAKSAYQYPLILKQLWHAPIVQAPDQEVVYRDLKRFTYRDIRERIGRLASALHGIGVRPGDTVGVLDWDSNRFLEAFFAIPMMGAVLQTVNVRLSPEQIAYTINHAKCSTLIVNDEFAGLVEGLKSKLTNVKRMVVMSDQPAPRTGDLPFVGEYEALLAAASPRLRLSRLRREHAGDDVLYDRNDRAPEGRVLQPSAARSAYAVRIGVSWHRGQCKGRFCRDDVYMPITPMFHVHAWGFPWAATLAGVKQVYPGRYEPAMLAQADQAGRRDLHPRRADDPADVARRGGRGKNRSCRIEDGDRRIGVAEGACQTGARRGDRYLCRLWHVGDRSDDLRRPCQIQPISAAIRNGRSKSAPEPA